ncbi:MAG: CHAT domain-containing protein [Chloroflexota bacterium]
MGKAKPLVFLNACQVGQAGLGLTDIGGWAKQFLDAGVAGFIGAYWSIFDEPAYTFVEALYEPLLNGMPIGEAVKAARLHLRKKFQGDPTWLAYVVYADPLATIQA